VDISLAVEMLYMATVPNAYEIACIITGDKDFIPAMQKTRLMGKRVALCSMRNGCNADLVAEQAQLRDFEVIYLDEYLDEIIVPIVKQGSKCTVAAHTKNLFAYSIFLVAIPFKQAIVKQRSCWRCLWRLAHLRSATPTHH